MSQVINTNIASLNAQRNLTTTQGQLQTTLQRLSTGLRINSAKDDAAGLAIAERFTSQINGLNQAIRNANDGISFAQTAEGALMEVGNLLQRVRVLSVQSLNDTNSASDREALNQEVQQAIKEINRIAHNTQFNNRNILDGTLRELIFQVGANSGQTILQTGLDTRGSQLGAVIAGTDNLGNRAIGFERYSMADGSLDLSNGVEIDTDGFFVNGVQILAAGGTLLAGDAANDENTLAAALQQQIRNAIDAEYGSGTGDGYRVVWDGTNYLFLNGTGREVEVDVNLIEGANATSLDTSDPAIIATYSGFYEMGVGMLNFGDGTGTNPPAIPSTDISLRVNGSVVNVTTTPAAGVETTDDLRSSLETAINGATAGIEVIYDQGSNQFIFFNNSGERVDIDLTIKDSFNNQARINTSVLGVDSDTFNNSIFDYLEQPGNAMNFAVDIRGTDGNSQTITVDGARSLSDVVGQINAQTESTGVTAYLSDDGKNINFTSALGTTFEVSISAPGNIGGAGGAMTPVVGNASRSFNVDDFSVKTTLEANMTLMAVDYAITQITGARAIMGAIQNRFESNISNLRVGSENLSASRSRIQDADFAEETAELTRNQILQQAGTSVLAQANQLPQGVLQLLQS
ncbi:flagellin [Ectothiorhodospira lacustris]|uniref:flagellin N-terminal helical domain-containing protein n=1 Tax=Ectothiorhodospira lacustris TaxID=2899127 RepID=UPI00237893AE|nr:flagellin [Ectothiorhodospira lacustris]